MTAVSVIVPCYNCEKTVERTLDSLRNQTLKDLEIVAINDGSEDSTLSVLQNFWTAMTMLNLSCLRIFTAKQFQRISNW